MGQVGRGAVEREGGAGGRLTRTDHHALGQLVLPVGELVVLPLVLPLVGEQLPGAV